MASDSWRIGIRKGLGELAAKEKSDSVDD